MQVVFDRALISSIYDRAGARRARCLIRNSGKRRERNRRRTIAGHSEGRVNDDQIQSD
jgi:hypothetical protein